MLLNRNITVGKGVFGSIAIFLQQTGFALADALMHVL